MPITKIKCSQCGMDIEIDEDGDSGVCPYCGSKYIIENAESINDKNQIGYEYKILIVDKNELNNTKKVLEAFKYEYVSQLIYTENEVRVTFKRYNKLFKKSKIISLEQEYNQLETDINHLKQVRPETYLIEDAVPILLVFGIFMFLLGLVFLIITDQLALLVPMIMGILMCTLAGIIIGINKKREAIINEFYEKINGQINDIQKRMNEILEEAFKL